jgi:electron transfer flavoprotein beta subunit
MDLVVIADGVVAVEGTVKAQDAAGLYRDHPVDRDLADDSTVEEALRLKKRLGSTLTLVSAAPAGFEKHMRHYIAAGCDRAIRIEGDPAALLDARLRACALASLLRSLAPWRAVLFLDRTGAGAPAVVPHYLAQLLDIPSVAQVVSAQPEGDELTIVRRGDGMVRTYRARARVALAVSSRAALRNPGFMDVHRSRKAQIEVVNADTLEGFTQACAHSCTTRALGVAPPPESKRETQALALGADETAERIARLCAPFLAKA